MSTAKLKIVGLVPGYDMDQVVEVAVDPEGTPLDFHWRRRLKDGSVKKEVKPQVVKPAKVRTTHKLKNHKE